MDEIYDQLKEIEHNINALKRKFDQDFEELSFSIDALKCEVLRQSTKNS